MSEEQIRRLTIAVRFDLAMKGLDTTMHSGGSKAAQRIARILDDHVDNDTVHIFLNELERSAESDREAK